MEEPGRERLSLGVQGLSPEPSRRWSDRDRTCVALIQSQNGMPTTHAPIIGRPRRSSLSTAVEKRACDIAIRLWADLENP